MISRYVLMLTLALLVVYMVSTFITLLWLACPFYGNLARFMANYQVAIVVYTLQIHSPIFCREISEIWLTTPINWTPIRTHLDTQPPMSIFFILSIDQEELGKAAEETGQETEARTLLGELFEIYYDNRSTQTPNTVVTIFVNI